MCLVYCLLRAGAVEGAQACSLCSFTSSEVKRTRDMLLSWYDEHQRTLPWRHGTTNGGYVWVTYEIKSTPTCKLLFEAIMDTWRQQ